MSGDRPTPAGPAGGARELRLRAVSTIVLVPLVIAATALGGVVFAAVVAVIGAAVHVEWVAVTGPAPGRLDPRFAAALGAGATVVAVALAAADLAPAGFVVLAVAALLAALADRAAPGRAALAATGVLYAGLPAAMLVLVRDAPGGLWPVIVVFVVVWATDILAYIGGRTMGGPKLWPRVSPKKTWSGALTGLAGGVVAGVAVAAIPAAPSLAAAVLAAALSIASQAGDLAESALKRRFGKKDSGRLIPGHGGVMDRVDGLLVAVVVLGLVDLAGLMPAGLGGAAE